MSGKYTQEELLKMAKELPNTYVVPNNGRLEVRMTAPLNIVEAAREMVPIKVPAWCKRPIPDNILQIERTMEQLSSPEPQVNPNEILHNMLDHIHDGNREELIGEMILMLGWLHKGGTMPNISKDTVTEDTIWIIPNN